MSQFSNQLQACMDAKGLNQTAVCEKTDVPHSQLSRYLRGEFRPPIETFEKLAKAFPREDREALLVAYLDDDVPASLKSLVLIVPRRQSSVRVAEEPPPSYQSRMPRELREAHEGLGAMALEDSELADNLISLWRIIRPRK